jgi:phage terminase small subunit
MARIGGGSKKYADGLTPLQERFAIEYMKCNGDASAAFRAANPICIKWQPKTIWVRASMLLAHDKVKRRIDKFRAEAAKRNEVTADSLAAELNKGMEYAIQFEQIGAYVSAIVAKARLFGLIVDKKEVRVGAIDKLPMEELKLIDDALSSYTRIPETIESEGPSVSSH